MQNNTGLLTGKTALITGAARRLGAKLARGFHEAGANVAIHYRNSSEEAGALADSLNAVRGGSAITLQLDLLQTGKLGALVEETVGRLGSLDILVNNASSFYPTPFGKIRESDWHELVGSNLKAPLFLSQAAGDALRKSRGCIINMIDIHARRPLRDHPVYCSAKAGLQMLTLSLARDLGPHVRVNGIAPGAILWPETGADEAAQQAIISRTPLGRAGDPEDILRTALFLAGNAPFVTGQIIAVDGGRSAGW